jgi:hypothetical protein
LFSEENIRIIAATVADTTEFGILRMIVADPQNAYRLLKDNHVNATLTDVLAITTESNANTFASTLNSFTKAGLSIEYMYCFAMNEKTLLILKVNNREKALEVLQQNKIEYLTENELFNL